jgi:spore coat protein CotH
MNIFFEQKLMALILATIFLFGCSGEGSQTPAPEQAPIIVQPPAAAQSATIDTFSFTQTNNPSLPSDIILDVSQNTISGSLPVNVSVKDLVATFEHRGLEVRVNNQLQAAGQTANDFTDVVVYQVNTNIGQTASYTVDLRKFTGLPIIYLSTEGSVDITSKDDYIDGFVWLDGGRDYVSLNTVPMEIRGRGNSTWGNPKKPYQMRLADKFEFLGMPNDRKWLFLAEYSDKTMLRNTIAFELGYLSNLYWTPAGEFAEVYLNDSYIGTYNITQKVEEDADRVDLGDNGYLLEIDQLERLDVDDVYFETDKFLINVKEPEIEWGSAELQEVSILIKEFEQSLFSAQFTDPINGYTKYIDIESFIDWFLISEITKNVDSQFFSSIYLHVVGEKIKMGPLWDFDLSFGNVDYADPQFPTGFWVKEHPWYKQLFTDPVFVDAVQERFAFFKAQQAMIVTEIRSQAARLQWAAQENDKKWQTIGIYVWPNPVVFDTYEAEVEHMIDWFNTRMDWLDIELNKL